jgi:hypothetical protein
MHMSDENLHEILEENLKLTKENNKILRKMQSAMRWGRVVKFFYWIIIIGISIGAYYYIQPLLDSLLETWQNVSKASADLRGVGESLPDISSLLGQ